MSTKSARWAGPHAWFWLLLGCCAMANAGAAAALQLALPEQVDQGSLIIARAPPGSAVSVDGRTLRVSAEGLFLLGAGRDRREPLVVEVRQPQRPTQRISIAVRTRDWPRERVDGVPPKTVEPPPELAQRIAREQASVAAVRRRDDARTDFAAGFDWPVLGRKSGRFGSARVYNGQPGSPHSGVDVAAAQGTPLRAPAPGVVTFAAPDLYLTGGTLVLDHGHGLSSVFLHLSRIDVRLGDTVQRGQIIAAVGSTGRATGPHMHWGINLFELRLDPEQVITVAAPAP